MKTIRAHGRLLSIGCALLATLALGVYVGSRAEADGIPRNPSMYYSGTLEEDGARVDDTRAFTLRFWSGPSAGATEVCTAVTAPDVLVEDGHFRIQIGNECTDVAHDNQDVWTELQVGTEAPLPRARLGAVPYAVESELSRYARGAAPGSSLEARLASLEAFVEARPVLSTAVTSFSTSETAWTPVPELTLDITSEGRPVSVQLSPGPDETLVARAGLDDMSAGQGITGELRIVRSSAGGGTPVVVGAFEWVVSAASASGTLRLRIPPGGFGLTDDTVPAGTHTYAVSLRSARASLSISLQNVRLQAWEGR